MSVFSDPLLFILMEAIVLVESGGDCEAIGEAGEVGPMQILQACIDDVNALEGHQFTLVDAKTLDGAKNIFYLYTRIYAGFARLGREATFEDLARIWNGGPNGYKNWRTRRYWRKVRRIFEQLKTER